MKIKSIKLTNVRGFDENEFNFINPNNGEIIKTIVLVGRNGAGKSTVLKSIVHCLTLHNSTYGGDLLDITDITNGSSYEGFQVSMTMEFSQTEKLYLYGADYLNRANTIEIDTIGTSKVLMADNKFADAMQIDPKLFDNSPTRSAQNMFLEFWSKFKSNEFDGGYAFYFDSFRFLPKIRIEGPNMLQMPSDVKENTLSSSINSDQKINDKFAYVKQWLVNLDFKRLKSPSSINEENFKHIVDALNKLFNPWVFSKITDNGEIIFQCGKRFINIDKLSDGFKNIFIIIGELLYRLSISKSNSKKSVFHKEAIVLIDEIDCHLHPKKQMTLIPVLRKLFPNIQIIATTHSPFVLDYLQPYEIYKLEEEDLCS